MGKEFKIYSFYVDVFLVFSVNFALAVSSQLVHATLKQEKSDGSGWKEKTLHYYFRIVIFLNI